MKLTTALPVAHMFFKHWHSDDTEVGIVVAKAAFGWRDGRFRSNAEPPSLCLVDRFENDGPPAVTPLAQEQDLAPGKPCTDLIVHAVARSPGAEPMSGWNVGLTIPDRLTYGFHVRGPSEWGSALLGWKLTTPELVQEVPLTYALAYGGASPGQKDGEVAYFLGNPAGKGFATPARLKGEEPFAAPQIGELAEFIAGDPAAEMTVHGFGPIAKAWLPRRAEAGTFDATWEATRHPRMPRDYSLRFWNAAHRRLQLDPPLRGTEVIELSGLSHAAAPIRVALPGAGLMLHPAGPEGDGPAIALTLDTVIVDLRDVDPSGHCLTMTWRAIVSQPSRFDRAEITGVRLEE